MTDPRTSGMSGPGSPDDDFRINGVEAPVGRFNGHTGTSVDEPQPAGDDGYDWQAPQALAPGGGYGEEPSQDYQRSAQAWWEQVRGANGAGGPTPGPGSNGMGVPVEQGETGAMGPVNAVGDHTEAISRIAPAGYDNPAYDQPHEQHGYEQPIPDQPAWDQPAWDQHGPDPTHEFVPAYSGGNLPPEEPDWGGPQGYAPRVPQPRPEPDEDMRPRGSRSLGGPRRARLSLRRVDPWSTLKFSLVLAVALFVVWMVAVGVLYGVLSGLGVFDKINSTVNEVNGSNSKLITPQIVLGIAGVVGGVSIVLFTALATVGSFIYNLCADMVGGLEVTLAERD